MVIVVNYSAVCKDNIIGASLSEPHTSELGGEISVRMYACLLWSAKCCKIRIISVH